MTPLDAKYKARLLDLLITEEVQGEVPVDLVDRVRRQFRERLNQKATNAGALVGTNASHKSFLNRSLVWLMAASVVIGFALLSLSQSDVELAPDGFKLGASAEWSEVDGIFSLSAGGVLVEGAHRQVRLGEHLIGQEVGRSVVIVVGSKDGIREAVQKYRDTFQDVHFNDKEKNMLDNVKNWVLRGTCAVCVLSGAVMISGERIEAQKAVGEETNVESKEIIEKKLEEARQKMVALKPAYELLDRKLGGANLKLKELQALVKKYESEGDEVKAKEARKAAALQEKEAKKLDLEYGNHELIRVLNEEVIPLEEKLEAIKKREEEKE